jgi:hypothetical protein
MYKHVCLLKLAKPVHSATMHSCLSWVRRIFLRFRSINLVVEATSSTDHAPVLNILPLAEDIDSLHTRHKIIIDLECMLEDFGLVTL